MMRKLSVTLLTFLALLLAGVVEAYSDGNEQYWLWKDLDPGAPGSAQSKFAETRVGSDHYRVVIWTTGPYGDVKYQWVKNQGAATGTGTLTSQSDENGSCSQWAAISRTQVINTADGTILIFVGFERTDNPDYGAVRAFRFNPGTTPTFTQILRLRDVNRSGTGCSSTCGSYFGSGQLTVSANANSSGKGFDLFVPAMATAVNCSPGNSWSILHYSGNGANAAGTVAYESLPSIANASPAAASFDNQSFASTFDHNSTTFRVFYQELVGSTYYLRAVDSAGSETTLDTFGGIASNAVFAAGSGLTGSNSGAMVAWKNPVNNNVYVRDFRTSTTRQVLFEDGASSDGSSLAGGSFQLLPSRQPVFLVQRSGLIRVLVAPVFTSSITAQYVARNVTTLYTSSYDPTGAGVLWGFADMPESLSPVPQLSVGDTIGTSWSTFNPVTGDITLTSRLQYSSDKYVLSSTINGQSSFTTLTENFTSEWLDIGGDSCFNFDWAVVPTPIDVSPEYVYKVSTTISDRTVVTGFPNLRLRTYDPTNRNSTETVYHDVATGSNDVTLTHTFAGRPNLNSVYAFTDLFVNGPANMDIKVDQMKVERVALQGWPTSIIDSWDFNSGMGDWVGFALVFPEDSCDTEPVFVPSSSWQLTASAGKLIMSCDRNMLVASGVPLALTAGNYRVRIKGQLTSMSTPANNASPNLRVRLNGSNWSTGETFATTSVWSTDSSSHPVVSKTFFLTVPSGRSTDYMAIDMWETNPALGDTPDSHFWTWSIDDLVVEKY